MKQKSPLNQLRDLIIADKMTKYPNMRREQIYVNTFDSAKPERRELKRIVKFIELSGGIAAITDSSAVRIDKRETYVDTVGFKKTVGRIEYRKNTNFRVGHSDITATWKGNSLFIELKRIYRKSKDRQSKVQKDFESKVLDSGGIYVIVNSFDHFYNWGVENGYICSTE